MSERIPPDSTPRDPRAEYDSLVPLARRLLGEGRPLAEVLQAIYGVDLPAEAYAFDAACAAGLELPLYHTFHPWELLALQRSGQVRGDDLWSREQETRAFVRYPDFLPLCLLAAGDATHDNHLIGYSLAALRRGDSTIFAHHGDLEEEDDAAAGGEPPALEQLGPSLLDVLHEWWGDHVRMLTAQLDQNLGGSSLSPEHVEHVRALLGRLDELRRAAGGG